VRLVRGFEERYNCCRLSSYQSLNVDRLFCSIVKELRFEMELFKEGVNSVILLSDRSKFMRFGKELFMK
jgi:hypothetical protein